MSLLQRPWHADRNYLNTNQLDQPHTLKRNPIEMSGPVQRPRRVERKLEFCFLEEAHTGCDVGQAWDIRERKGLRVPHCLSHPSRPHNTRTMFQQQTFYLARSTRPVRIKAHCNLWEKKERSQTPTNLFSVFWNVFFFLLKPTKPRLGGQEAEVLTTLVSMENNWALARVSKHRDP